MAGDDDEMFTTRSLNVTPKTTEHFLYAVINLAHYSQRESTLAVLAAALRLPISLC